MPRHWQPSARLDVIRERARVYAQIREFFERRGCLEVDTPLLMRHANPDPNVSAVPVNSAAETAYLQPSPEFAMKRLLAAGSGSIFQICHAFRDAERGRLHHREFSMLEWYRVDFDYRQLMDEIELLITSLNLKYCEFERVRYDALFQRHLGIDIEQVDQGALRDACAAHVTGCDPRNLDFDQCLDLLMGVVVAPSLEGYQFVYDYPLSQAALARRKPGSAFAERFELLYDGIELANGFSELTDASEQRARFERDNRIRAQRGLPRYDLDEDLLAALERGLPDCAGAALGLDRLMMVLLGLDSIDEVLTFTP